MMFFHPSLRLACHQEQSIDNGYATGPRILPSMVAISQTSRHSDYRQNQAQERLAKGHEDSPMMKLGAIDVLHANRKRGRQSGDVGSHFSTARGNDRLLFELAYQLEHAKPWANRKSPIVLFS